tara:strand:- start:186 stop:500 length:315 start_codon:yes stop_codon:yes gene_type:complete
MTWKEEIKKRDPYIPEELQGRFSRDYDKGKPIPEKEDETIDALISEEPKLIKEMLNSLENALSLSREVQSRTKNKKVLKVFEDIGDIFAKAYPEVDLADYVYID